SASSVTQRPVPPHPEKEHWFFGNAYYLVRYPINYLTETTQTFKGVFMITSMFTKIMVVDDPEYIKHIMQDNNKNYLKWFNNDVLKMLLGNGLLTSEGEFWRKQRRLAQPAFHRERLAGMVNAMVDCTREQIEKMEVMPQKNNVDVSMEMMALTLNIVARAMFSSEVKSAIDIVSHEIETTSQLIMDRFKTPFRLPNWVPTPTNLRERKSIENLNNVLNPIIQTRRKSTGQFHDLLAMLMEAKDEDTGEQMSDQQLRDETMTIFLAGHETTAVALSWLWYLLDQNPVEAQKLYDEIDTVLQGKTPTLEDLMRLPYSRLVIDESLRLYPPAWIIGRENIEDDVIGGHHIPKGYAMLIPAYHIHRDPRLWDQPLVFNPERFRKENIKEKHRFAYFPFGGGPRQCIGNNFALMEMQIILVMMLQKFRFKLTKGFQPELNPMVTLRTKHGMRMDIISR
ncbi:MAG: cytochrome, partial [Bacteroidota bacterium]|nr:cytochrome [Bacteroidota bacterium]